jgi:tRNA A-37 threonylcarbamoyl transferase component Bud32
MAVRTSGHLRIVAGIREEVRDERGRRRMSAPGGGRTPAIGDLLQDRYRIEEFLGAGAMASVFRGADLQLGRDVAIKVFTARADQLGDRERRQKEARLLATVTHPSLITLYDGCFADGDCEFLVLEHIGGGTLRTVMEAGPLPAQAVAAVAADVGDALRVVHEAGIVHRDVTPGNILLRTVPVAGSDVRAVLSDFGIAHAQDAARLTSPGIAIGTAAYMSPEQARGADPHPASDIYSFGLVLLEALTGVRAFGDLPPVESIVARLTTPPVVPRELGYGWRSLLTAMTAIDPAERPEDEEVVRRARELGGGTAARSTLATAALESTQPLSVITAEAAALPPLPPLSAPEAAARGAAPGTPAVTAPPGRADQRRTARAGRARSWWNRRLLISAAIGVLAIALVAVGWAALPLAERTPAPVTRPTENAPVDTVDPVVVDIPSDTTVEDTPVGDGGSGQVDPGQGDPAPAEPDLGGDTEPASDEGTPPGQNGGNGGGRGENSGNGNGAGSNNGNGPGENSGNGNGPGSNNGNGNGPGSNNGNGNGNR